MKMLKIQPKGYQTAANKIIGDLDDILENKKSFIKQNNNEASRQKKNQ